MEDQKTFMLKLLFEDLKKRYKIYYIYISFKPRCIGKFLGVIRSRVKYRLRAYILGKNGGVFLEAGNFEQDDTPDLYSRKKIHLTGQCFQKLTTSTITNYDSLNGL